MTDTAQTATAFAVMTFGALLIIAGAVLNVTVIGLPAGLGVDAIGVLLVVFGASMLGFDPFKKDSE